MYCCKSCEKGLPCESKDQVGAPPPTGYFSCDTKACQDYVHAVEDRSKAFTERFKHEAELVESQKDYPMSADKKAEFLANFVAWVQAARLPWLKKYPDLIEQCASTFPGPCKDAIGIAAKHESHIDMFEAKFKAATGKTTGATEVPQTGPNGQQGGNQGGSGLFSVGGFDPTKYIVLGVLAYIAIQATKGGRR